jgi:hypothetical protein
MARHAQNTLWGKHHGRGSNRISAVVAPWAGTFIVLQGHVVKVTRLARLQVDPPEDFTWTSDRDNPRKMAGFTTDVNVRIMGDLLIVPTMANQTGGPFPPAMAKLCGLRVTHKTGLPAMRAGAICLQVNRRESPKSGEFVVPMTFEAKRRNLLGSVRICRFNQAMTNHASLIGKRQCGQGCFFYMADAALQADGL